MSGITKWGVWSLDVMAEAMRLRKAGYTYADIVLEMKLEVHPETLARRLRRAEKEGLAAAAVRRGAPPGADPVGAPERRTRRPKDRSRAATPDIRTVKRPKQLRNFDGVYDPAVDRPVIDPARLASLAIPSRRGRWCFYRDGRVEAAT